LRLEEFPRPPEDNGRGLHWSPSPRHPAGSALDFWLGELHAMHITWLKLLDDGLGSSLGLCQRLLAEGIMPIVRLQRSGPLPHTLTSQEKATIGRLVDVGVRYFELENEPDLPYEWENDRPPDWFDRIIDAFIADADSVIAVGGLPAIPAMALSSERNPVRAIVERGRQDLFEHGVWWAIHSYTLNRPLHYPDDPVNREGTPVTPEVYSRHYPWGWNEPIDLINRWRAEGKQPEATVSDDPQCFRGYELAGAMAREILGREIPVISTEGGAVTGWRDDRRYPRLNPWTAAVWTEEINNFLQNDAPPWYLALCHWLIADQRMDPSRPHAWESHCWYTHYWDEQFGFDGILPVVDRVKAMPSHPRQIAPGNQSEEHTMPKHVHLAGHVRDAHGHPLSDQVIVVGQDDREVARTTTDAQGKFDFSLPGPGSYTFFVEGRGPLTTLDVQEGQMPHLDLTLEPLPPRETVPGESRKTAVSTERGTATETPGAASTTPEAPPPPVSETVETPSRAYESAIQGHMPGARPGLRLVLRNDRGQTWEQVLAEDLRFSFAQLPPGVYALTLVGVGTVAENVALDGKNTMEITFPIQGVIQGWVLGAPPEAVATLVSNTYGWQRTVALSPQGQFRFVELPPGTYQVEVAGHVVDHVEIDGLSVKTLPALDLRPPHRAGIQGRVRDATGQVLPEVRVRLLREGQILAEGETALNGTYRFDHLPEGEARLVVPSPEGDIVQTVRLQQDQITTVDIRFPAPSAKGVSPTAAVTTGPEASVTVSEEGRGEKGHTVPVTASEGVAGTSSRAVSAQAETPREHVFPKGESPAAEAGQSGTKSVEIQGESPGEREQEEGPAVPVESGISSLPSADALAPGVETLPSVSPPSPGTTEGLPALNTYVLFPPPDHPLTHAIILAALPYLRRSGATAGFSIEEAGHARRVLIIGGESVYSQDVEAALREAGCEVDRVVEDVAQLVELFRTSAQVYDEGAYS